MALLPVYSLLGHPRPASRERHELRVGIGHPQACPPAWGRVAAAVAPSHSFRGRPFCPYFLSLLHTEQQWKERDLGVSRPMAHPTRTSTALSCFLLPLWRRHTPASCPSCSSVQVISFTYLYFLYTTEIKSDFYKNVSVAILLSGPPSLAWLLPSHLS